MSGMRYPLELVDEAKGLGRCYEPEEIQAIFEQRGMERVPCADTIRNWLRGRVYGDKWWIGIRDPQLRSRVAAGAGRPPLELTQVEAFAKAMSLRQRGLTYSSLVVVMGMYHGHWATEDQWRGRLRRGGAPPRQAGAGSGSAAWKKAA